MLICDTCGNDFEEGICMDCVTDLRAAAKRTPVELAAGELLNICKDIYNDEIALGSRTRKILREIISKVQDNPSLQANLAESDADKFSG